MKRIVFFALFSPLALFAQKKPLDHTVYDGWQSIGEKVISNDGKWVVYTITPQEGDADLYIQSSDGTGYKKQVPRGYNAAITEDSRYVVFRIRPTYKETRDARIKKKRPDEMPRDSIGMIELGKEQVTKVAKVRSYKTPEKAAGWVAYHKEREAMPASRASIPTQRTVDSLRKKIDSLTMLVTEMKNIKGGNRDALDAEEEPLPSGAANEGTELVLRELIKGKDQSFRNVSEYYFDENGTKLVMEVTKSARDTGSRNAVVVYDLIKRRSDTILKGGNDFRNFALSKDGSKLAFVAERDTNTKALQKFYQLYIFESGNDSARVLCDKFTAGMKLGMTISENGTLTFSRTGNRLMFGTAPILPPKDTSLIEIDLVKVDIWNYKDDYLQTQQLFQLNNELKRSYLAVYDFGANKIEQLGSPEFQNIISTDEGEGKYFLAISDTNRRVPTQWGEVKRDIYAVDVTSGAFTLVKKNHQGQMYTSPGGKYFALYDSKLRHYFAWDGKGLKNITSTIKAPLFNEEFDMPNDPNPYGIMRWTAGDSTVMIYDRYGVWEVDPKGVLAPKQLVDGRKQRATYRYLQFDPEERYLLPGQLMVFRVANEVSKKSSIIGIKGKETFQIVPEGAHAVNFVAKPKSSEAYLYTKESFDQSPALYIVRSVQRGGVSESAPVREEMLLAGTNAQQSSYNWVKAELYKWKTFDGKPAEGILYKPEDFDSTKKYPMLIYFYEKLTEGMYNYTPPSPTPSRLNIPFFVSRGYLVLAPDISYTKGHPAKDAYNYIVSGAQALAKRKWVDAKNIGIQGQSWGGYQVLALLTQTSMFKAAWAGAPVVNMFSAYGGIRWESGNNRQSQYEKGQSRIGATPWQRPDLYMENSPFFHLPKIKTPLVIMANDADGAVPWYQGIELFTAMRRLDKPVWMLNYNGEAHNLVERKNRKDIQIREQQYFDWLLKGEKAPEWIISGVPAVEKGRNWGLNLVDQK